LLKILDANLQNIKFEKTFCNIATNFMHKTFKLELAAAQQASSTLSPSRPDQEFTRGTTPRYTGKPTKPTPPPTCSAQNFLVSKMFPRN
jgi:hypothetical protein